MQNFRSTLESSEAGAKQADFIRCFTSCSQDYPQILWINAFGAKKE